MGYFFLVALSYASRDSFMNFPILVFFIASTAFLPDSIIAFGALITAVPIGGGTISETLIITMLGFPIGTLGMLTIIAAIIDPPATMLNVVGDSASSMLVTRIIDGRNWLKKKSIK